MTDERTARWAYATRVALGSAMPRIEVERSQKIPSLEDWWNSSEARVARELLRAANREIDLGYSEACMGKTSAVVLTAEGFCSHSGVVGIAQAYTNEEPERTGLICSEAVRRSIEYAFEEIQTENDLVEFIREKLDDIARDVNEKARDKIYAEIARQRAREAGMFVSSQTK